MKLCLLGIHKYSNWDTLRTGELKEIQYGKIVIIGHFEEQRKYCLHCGKVKLNSKSCTN